MTSSTCSSCGALVPTQDTFCPSCGMRALANPVGVSHPYARARPDAATLASALLVGQMIGGRYRVEAPISTGAMGEVWRGRDDRLQGRPCAIKVVRLGGVPAEEQRELTAWFARESAVLSSLRHPAICDIRDVVDEADAHYLILELIDGRTLADELAAHGTPGLPETDVVSWAIDLCDALTYLHGHTPPVIFRDLKPQNIMRRLDGRVVIIDFGIARAMVPIGGTAIGTGGYAPPEQYQGLADARSDVYGLAATLHHLLTGRDPSHYPPFSYPSVRTLIPKISPHVDVAIARALNLVPDDRFASAEAFAAALGGAAVNPARRTSNSTPVSGRPALQGMERLDALVVAARTTTTPLPHVLLVGPPPAGILLHHVAEALAADMGVEIRTANAHNMVHPGDLIAILTNMQDQQLLYIDDVNTLKSVVRSTLHGAMVDFVVDFVIGKGPAARTLAMDLQRFTIVGGMASRRVLTSEVTSYFAEHIDASTTDDVWRQRIETGRLQPPQPAAQGQSSGQTTVSPPPVFSRFGADDDADDALPAALVSAPPTSTQPTTNYQSVVTSVGAPNLPPSAWPLPPITLLDSSTPADATVAVTLRDILTADAWAQERSPLALALGTDTSRAAIVVDLATAPHLLIAGSTGSGKSTSLHAIIAALLFRNDPDRLRFLMIDTKMVDLTIFNGVPHLLHPVVTEVDKIVGTLTWVLKEMQRRYTLFAQVGARTIGRYNELQLQKAGSAQEKPLPSIVFVIAELADLMAVSPVEAENSLTQLASLGRATGIHLVVSTQRPTVNIISGAIKANIPARIAFRVPSRADSRVILDQTGAEMLTGRGSMLYHPADSSAFTRVQGAYISDAQIERLVEFWSHSVPPSLGRDGSALSNFATSSEDDDVADENNDKLFAEAVKVVRAYDRVSVSLLQRRLSIGYSRAARLMDQLEERGIIGPFADGRARVVRDSPPNPTLSNSHTPISVSVPSSVGPALSAPIQGATLHKALSAPSSPQTPTPRPQAGRWIEVSARLLSWPRLCACCSRPATMDITASYTRVSGKRVIRTNTRSWPIPVCMTCAEHGRIYSQTKGATERAIAWSVFILVGGCVLGAVVGSSGGGLNFAFVAIGVIGAIALLIVLLRSAQADRQAAQDMLQDTCCSIDYPVVYQGWNGSVHSFYFRNGLYAQAFADANAKKLL